MKTTFAQLSSIEKRLVSIIAGKANTIIPYVLASTSHIGELWEAFAFFNHYSQDREKQAELVARFQHGGAGKESILDVIHRAAPGYLTLGQRYLENDLESVAEFEQAVFA